VLGASELYELKSYPMHFTKFRSFLGEFLQVGTRLPPYSRTVRSHAMTHRVVRPSKQESAKLFELNIFTKGSRAYALDLAAIMDPDQRFFGANWSARPACAPSSPPPAPPGAIQCPAAVW
jgi:hypothetical protein